MTKRIIALLMVLTIVFSLAACNNNKNPKPTENENPTENVEQTEAPTTAPIDTPPADLLVENPITFFSMTMGEDYGNIKSLMAFANEDGVVYVEYVSDVKKVGELAPAVMHEITTIFANTNLSDLNGASEYGEGEANASMYIEYADGTVVSADYVGEIPEAYTNGYAVMDECLKGLTEALEIYVPQPEVLGEVDEDVLAEMLAIFGGSALPNLDGIIIAPVETSDEFFGESAGLTNADGIAACANGAPMMMSVAYSLVVVKLDGANADDVCADFESKIDWRKWVCVAPSNALIATKDDMVLCLQAADDMYTMTVNGIEAAGWTAVKTLDNPDM